MAKILVVDDDPAFTRLMRIVLDQGDHEPLVSHTLTEAMAQLASEQPELVLLDLQLKSENGADLLPWARSRGYGAAFIIVSGWDCQSIAAELDADGWLNKPFDPDRLLRHVDMQLARRRPLQRLEVDARGLTVPAVWISQGMRWTSA